MTGNNKNRKYVISMTLVLCLTLMIGITAFAESAGVTLKISSTELVVGTSVNITIDVHNDKTIKNISLQGLDGFDVLGNNQSVSTQIINGKKTTKKTYNYVLMPKAVGEYTLKAVVDYEDSKDESQPIKVNVKEDDTDVSGENSDIFVKTSITKDSCYFGEKIVISYDLYTRFNLDNYGFVDDINLDGFIVNDVPSDELKANYTTINGVQYLKYEARKLVVIPTKTGKVTIPSYNFQVNLRSEDFFARSMPKYIQTESITLNVESVPEEGRPDDFTGLVGKLSARASYDKANVNYGDPVTLNVRLAGTVNMDSINTLYKNEDSHYSIYETPQKTNESVMGDTITSSREYEVIIIPKDTGSVMFAPLRISYFDTDSKSYEYAEIPGKVIQVTGDKQDGSSGQIDYDNSNGAEAIEISQVTYNEENDDEIVIRISKKVLYGFIAILALVFLALVVKVYTTNLFKKNINRQLEINIKNATNSEELYDILYKFILEKYSVSIKSKSKREIEKLIDDPNVYENISSAIDYLEHEKFYVNQDLEEAKKNILTYIKNAKNKN